MALDQISIGKFSIMTRLSRKALHLYDKKELLVPEQKDDITGYRYYTIRQIEVGIRIKLLVNLGFSLSEIAEILDIFEIDETARIHELFAKKLSETQLEIHRLKKIEEVLVNHQNTMDLIKLNLSQPTIKDVPKFRVLSKFGIGSYGEVISQLIQDIMGVIYNPDNQRNMVKITGPVMYVCHDREFKENDAQIEVAIPFAGKVSVSDPEIEIKNLPACQMASVLYTGVYGNVGQGYQSLFRFIEEQGYVPAGNTREIYLNNPEQVAEEELLTEIQVPIAKNAK